MEIGEKFRLAERAKWGNRGRQKIAVGDGRIASLMRAFPHEGSSLGFGGEGGG